jgi:hypothetical protein
MVTMLDSLPFKTRERGRQAGAKHASNSPMAVEADRPARHPDAARHGMHPARRQQHSRRHHDNLVHPNGRTNILCRRSQDDALRHQRPRRCLPRGPAAAGERRMRRPGNPTPRLQAGRPAAGAVPGISDTRPSQSARQECGAPSLPSACQRHRLTCRRRYTSASGPMVAGLATIPTPRYGRASSPPRYSAPASGADVATLGPVGMKLKYSGWRC